MYLYDAGRSVPAVGANIPALLVILLIGMPLWLLLGGPSFVALITLLVILPKRVNDTVQHTWRSFRTIISRQLTGPYRLYFIGGSLIALAIFIRIIVWLVT